MRGDKSRRWGAAVAALVFLGVAAAVIAVSAPDADLVAARAAAKRILSLTRLPAGAVKQSTDPSLDGSLDRTAPLLGGQLVDRHQYWTLSGSPSSVSAYVRSHPPPGSRDAGLATTGVPPYFWSEMRIFRGVAGRLTSEILQVSVAAARGGGAAVRADAEVLWRPSWEHIPTGSRIATVRLNGTAQPTLTGVKERRLRDLINADPVVGRGFYGCPIGYLGQAVTVTFLDARARPLARASSNSVDGCDFLRIRVEGRRGPVLSGRASLVQRLFSLGALVRCTARQLTVSVSGASDYPAGDAAKISIHNRVGSPCSLKGFPSLELLSATGRRLLRAHTPGRSPSSVATAPGHAGVASGVYWPPQPRRCRQPSAASAIVRLPGIAHLYPVSLKHGPNRFGPCSGELTLSPIGP